MIQFIEYPKCSTCQKAGRWLREHGLAFESRHIVEAAPTAQELEAWSSRAGIPAGKLFNTSGLAYRSMGLKEKLPGLSDAEKFALLASNGMLIKRPLVVGEGVLLVGFREKQWEEALL